MHGMILKVKVSGLKARIRDNIVKRLFLSYITATMRLSQAKKELLAGEKTISGDSFDKGVFHVLTVAFDGCKGVAQAR